MTIKKTAESNEPKVECRSSVCRKAVRFSGAILVLVSAVLLEARPASIKGPIRSFDDLDKKYCYLFDLVEKAEITAVDPGLEAKSSELAPSAPLGWTTSGLWRGTDLLLMDHLYSTVVTVPVGGAVHVAPNTPDTLESPWFLAPNPDGSYITLEPDRMAVVHDQEVEGFFQGDDDPYTSKGRLLDGGSIQLTGVFQAASMSDSTGAGVLAMADLNLLPKSRKGEETPLTKLLYLSRTGDRYEPFYLFEDNAKLQNLKRVFYTKDLKFLAASGTRGFALILEEIPWIAQVEHGSQSFKRIDLPEDFNHIKTPNISYSIPRSTQDFIDQSLDVYKKIEMSSMAVGLYSWEDSLFILIKSAGDPDTRATAWDLVKITSEGRSSAVLRLPTQAPSVTLVPGDDYWAVVEKGKIGKQSEFPIEIMYRSAQSAVLIPSSWVLGKSGPGQKSGTDCRQIAVGSIG